MDLRERVFRGPNRELVPQHRASLVGTYVRAARVIFCLLKTFETECQIIYRPKFYTPVTNLQSRLARLETQVQRILLGEAILRKSLGRQLLLLRQLPENVTSPLVLLLTQLQKMNFVGTICNSN